MFSGICCPSCKKSLKVTFISGGVKVYSCKCFQYPFLGGVLYLKKDRLATQAVRQIKNNKFNSAFMTLAHVRLLLYIPVRFILLTKIQISFNHFLSLLQIFSYDKPWSEYLINRKFDTSFKLATFSLRYFRKNDNTLDLGCGIGQLLPYISSKCRTKNIYGMDKSFLNLLIARRFFADNTITLICGDAEKGLPFKENFLNAILAVDSFHYIKQKYFFLKEISHALSKNGLLFIVHTINDSKIVYGNIMAIRPKTIFFLLRKLKFKKINIFPDSDIAYTVFASKENLLNNVWI